MGTRNLTILLLILLSAACKNREIKTASEEPVRVRLAGVRAGTISIPIHSSGVLVSSEEFKLSFKTSGIVSKINVKEGALIKKGDILASLNLSEISANVNQAKNGYDKALRDYKRAENLYRDSVSTLEQKQNASTALDVAKSTLDILRFNLEHSRIMAPDNGIILKQLVKENEVVSSGYPVFLFGSSGKFWKVKTALSDKDIVKINPGDSASVSVDAYLGKKFSAVVNQIGGMSNPYTGTYEIEMALQPTDFKMASGFIAGVDLFPSVKKTYSMIPVESLVEADGNHGYVYILTGTMTVQKVRINIETIVGSMAAVNGLPEGTAEVISEGVAYLKNGMKVKLIK
ncbi:MAG: efflux RND transporter periplasmic adaptor subunit [Bacteroidales bacterium]|jgi:RND family efflux transporter MFP subunit